MYKQQCLLLTFVLAISGAAQADFDTTGVYDPDDDPYHNQTDQSGTYESHIGDAGPGNVIDLATFQALIGPAFNTNAGGVVDCETGYFDGSELVANYGVGKTKSLTVTSTSGTIASQSGDGSGQWLPISGSVVFLKSQTADFVFDTGAISNGVPGEVVTHFAGTLLDRDGRNIAPSVTATFSGGGTVTAGATMSGEPPSVDQDTFFGFAAPPGQSIVSVSFDLQGFTYMDDLAFITSAFNPEPAVAWNPRPTGGTTVNLKKTMPLAWSPGDKAVSHEVYFSGDFDDVNERDVDKIVTDDPCCTITAPLELGETYYWCVDEVEADGTTIHRGYVWSFTAGDYLVLDNFEDYANHSPNTISQAWKNGLGYGAPPPEPPPYYPGNGTGSVINCAQDPFSEQDVVHSGSQSMQYLYDNNKYNYLNYSEAGLTLNFPRDWTERGVKMLSLWFRGYPASVGSFVEGPVGTYTMRASGRDIWDTSDEFHFAWKILNGAGSIEVKVQSVQNTNVFAKAGVMIRETPDPNSAFAAVYITPGRGCRFFLRDSAGVDAESDSAVSQLKNIEAPHWVKLERTASGDFKAYNSDDPCGTDTWHELAWNPRNIQMNQYVCIGLVLTSRDADTTCEAKFSNLATSGDIFPPGEWTYSQDVGMSRNEAEPMYVVVQDSNGSNAVVYHDDANAALAETWTQWNIDMDQFSNQNVDLTDVNKLSIGLGDRDDPKAGGLGTMYFDDIRLYRLICAYPPGKPIADFNGNCVLDYADLQIMAYEWLVSGPRLEADLHKDNEVNFRDYAIMSEVWRDERQHSQ